MRTRTFLLWGTILAVLILFLLAAGGSVAQEPPNVPLVISLVDADLRLVGVDNGDWTGYFASPAGDVNGDGLGDLFIGAPMAGNKECPYPPEPGEECATLPKGEGVAYLVLGRPLRQWPSSPMNLADADASFLGCKTFTMTARQLYTAGDVNGDGFDDMLVSGWKCGDTFQGKAYLILGRPNVAYWGSQYPIEQVDASFVGEYDWDFLSYYVSTAGDVNADGFDDFLITSTHYDITTTQVITNVGKTYLILGRAAADWGTDYDVALADASFLGEAEEDRIGRSASGVGDVNGDGYDDFVIASISSDYGGLDAGQNYLFLGRAAPGDPGYDPARPWWGSDFSVAGADASFVGEAAGDESGRRVSWAGDVNGDGLDDFIIGAARNGTVAPWAGITHLILGRAAADWGLRFHLSGADASFTGERFGDQAGRRLAGAMDVNNDGYDDFIIGAPHNKRGGLGVGSAYLIFGRAAADWGSYYSLSFADVIYVGRPDVGVAGYDQGWLGDFSGDGIDDFLIAAYGGRNKDTVPGDVYVMLGGDAPRPTAFEPSRPVNYAEWQRFGSQFWEPNGWSDLQLVQLVLGRTVTDTQALNVRYRVDQNAFSLWDSSRATWVGPCAPGEAMRLASPAVKLDCGQSAVNAVERGFLNLQWAVDWVGSFGGAPQLHAWLRAVDLAGNDSGFVEFPWPADLAIRKRVQPTTSVQAGSPVTYTLIFGNAGGATASNVVVTDLVPGRLQGLQYQANLPVTPVGGVTYAWNVGDLAPTTGGTITITGVLGPEPTPGGVLTNTATITGTVDAEPRNNASSALLAVDVWRLYVPLVVKGP